MKVMLDTNILISTALFPGGTTAQAFRKALISPFEPVVCDYIIDELQRKFREKFYDRAPSLETFIQTALPHIRVIPTPKKQREEEKRIRDVKDRPILRAAVSSGVEFFLTGDKDFLEVSIPGLKIVSVQDFLSI